MNHITHVQNVVSRRDRRNRDSAQRDRIKSSSDEAAASNVYPAEQVLGVSIDAISLAQAIEIVDHWAEMHSKRMVCFCNVHSIVSAYFDAQFAENLSSADLALADGAPIAWKLRFSGHPAQQRVSGPDLMWRYLARASTANRAVFLYGGTQEKLQTLASKIVSEFSTLRIVGAYAPPFRQLDRAETDAVVQLINGSGANIVFVGLGCPKQENWMAELRERIDAVLVGVGAAFDFHAGSIKRAPHWMQRSGLEWLHRLAQDPRRLWKRYLNTNIIFLCLLGHDFITGALAKVWSGSVDSFTPPDRGPRGRR